MSRSRLSEPGDPIDIGLPEIREEVVAGAGVGLSSAGGLPAGEIYGPES